MGHWQDFLDELAVVETQYWTHFKSTKLSDHYTLNEDENQSLRFCFKEDSDLPQNIKDECLELFVKHQTMQRMA